MYYYTHYQPSKLQKSTMETPTNITSNTLCVCVNASNQIKTDTETLMWETGHSNRPALQLCRQVTTAPPRAVQSDRITSTPSLVPSPRNAKDRVIRRSSMTHLTTHVFHTKR